MIQQESVSDDLGRWIDDGFARYDLEEMGTHGVRPGRITFVAYEQGKRVGAIVAQLFWGQLHVKKLFVEKEHRGRNVGTQLMERIHDYGREQGCHFAWVETMNHQASGFYVKMGYAEEFRRPGYAVGGAFIYLRKDLRA